MFLFKNGCLFKLLKIIIIIALIYLFIIKPCLPNNNTEAVITLTKIG